MRHGGFQDSSYRLQTAAYRTLSRRCTHCRFRKVRYPQRWSVVNAVFEGLCSNKWLTIPNCDWPRTKVIESNGNCGSCWCQTGVRPNRIIINVTCIGPWCSRVVGHPSSQCHGPMLVPKRIPLQFRNSFEQNRGQNVRQRSHSWFLTPFRTYGLISIRSKTTYLIWIGIFFSTTGVAVVVVVVVVA
jgi:hypothetical protein